MSQTKDLHARLAALPEAERSAARSEIAATLLRVYDEAGVVTYARADILTAASFLIDDMEQRARLTAERRGER
jgi:hypothetical protein